MDVCVYRERRPHDWGNRAVYIGHSSLVFQALGFLMTGLFDDSEHITPKHMTPNEAHLGRRLGGQSQTRRGQPR